MANTQLHTSATSHLSRYLLGFPAAPHRDPSASSRNQKPFPDLQSKSAVTPRVSNHQFTSCYSLLPPSKTTSVTTARSTSFPQSWKSGRAPNSLLQAAKIQPRASVCSPKESSSCKENIGQVDEVLISRLFQEFKNQVSPPIPAGSIAISFPPASMWFMKLPEHIPGANELPNPTLTRCLEHQGQGVRVVLGSQGDDVFVPCTFQDFGHAGGEKGR